LTKKLRKLSINPYEEIIRAVYQNDGTFKKLRTIQALHTNRC
jgi:hypothetical protein